MKDVHHCGVWYVGGTESSSLVVQQTKNMQASGPQVERINLIRRQE